MREIDGVTAVVSAVAGESFVHDGSRWRRWRKRLLLQQLSIDVTENLYETNLAVSTLAACDVFRLSVQLNNNAFVRTSPPWPSTVVTGLAPVTGGLRATSQCPAGSVQSISIGDSLGDGGISFIARPADDHNVFTADRLLYAQDETNDPLNITVFGDYAYHIR